MKNWMKILMWVGLGGGIGFFAGYQAGEKTSRKSCAELMSESDHVQHEINCESKEAIMRERKKAYDDGYSCGYYDCEKNNWRKFVKEYCGEKASAVLSEEPEPPMPEEPVAIGDEEEIEIPQLHPQHLVPVQITEEEYYENPWHYDQESLIFYEMDEVLFNKDTREAMTTKDDQDQVVGIGMLFNFYLKDGESLDAIFVKNDTMGTIFRIDRMDAAYMDEGADPEYEEEDLD